MSNIEYAYVAGGCFWGVEYFFNEVKGVIKTTVGYMGGKVENSSYEQVCTGTTGHAETVQIDFNPDIISYEAIIKRFFEIHDPTQVDRQGPDIGSQYRSEIFYVGEKQMQIAMQIILQLQKKGITIATKLIKATVFWPAEEYHQQYYKKNKKVPYCHVYTKKF